mmetsp:Transcript_137399/g.342716  ORF Transcript_137399/g.342716 Transcript_137399/m.342716 type:complete len:276 (+) Transcript_137399:280-1107(+)
MCTMSAVCVVVAKSSAASSLAFSTSVMRVPSSVTAACTPHCSSLRVHRCRSCSSRLQSSASRLPMPLAQRRQLAAQRLLSSRLRMHISPRPSTRSWPSQTCHPARSRRSNSRASSILSCAISSGVGAMRRSKDRVATHGSRWRVPTLRSSASSSKTRTSRSPRSQENRCSACRRTSVGCTTSTTCSALTRAPVRRSPSAASSGNGRHSPSPISTKSRTSSTSLQGAWNVSAGGLRSSLSLRMARLYVAWKRNSSLLPTPTRCTSRPMPIASSSSV